MRHSLWISTVLAAAGVLVACGSSSQASDSRTFVKEIRQNATAASVDSVGVIAELYAASDMTNIDQGSLDQIASDAKALHDHLTDFRSQLLAADGNTGSDQLDYITAENDLKNAFGSVESWAGSPNAKTLADMTSQLTSSITEYNSAVTKVWADASAGKAPTITLPK